MDILIFAVGLISLFVIVGTDVTRFKKNTYDPRITYSQLAKGDILGFISYVLSMSPILFLPKSKSQDIYALIVIIIIVLDKTILNVKLFKSKKVNFSLLETFIFDGILLFLGVLFLIRLIF